MPVYGYHEDFGNFTMYSDVIAHAVYYLCVIYAPLPEVIRGMITIERIYNHPKSMFY